MQLFDDRLYYSVYDPVRGENTRAELDYAVTGVAGFVSYPFSFYRRGEVGVGYRFVEDRNPIVIPGDDGVDQLVFQEYKVDYPLIQGALVGDSTRFASWGPVAGRRWRLDAYWAPDFDNGGTMTQAADLDARQYIPVTLRSQLALRLFAGASGGNFPITMYFGGLDTIRSTDWGELSGDRAFFANIEYRFPLIDYIAMPFLAFQGLRGVVFFDVGGAWFQYLEDAGFYNYKFYDKDEGRLQDGISAYGWGFTVSFLGWDLNWDFAQRWDFENRLDKRTAFWIGTRF